MKSNHTFKTCLFLFLLLSGSVFSSAQAQDDSNAISASDWLAAGMSETMAITSKPTEVGSGYYLGYVNTLGQLQFMYLNGTTPSFTLSTNTGTWKQEAYRFYPTEASDASAKAYFYKTTNRWLKYDDANSKYIITTTSGEADRLVFVLTGVKGYVNGTGSYGDGIAEKGWDSYPMVWYDAYLFYKTATGKYIHVGVEDGKLTRINTHGSFDASKKIRLYAANGQRVLKLHRNEDPDATSAEAKAADDYTLVNFAVNLSNTQTTSPYALHRAGYTFLGWSTDPKATEADARYSANTWPLNKPESSSRWEYTGDDVKKYVLNLYAVWRQEKVWKVEYGYNATVRNVTFTTDPTDARYITATIVADNEVQYNGKVYFKITSEGVDGSNKQWWGFEYGSNHEPEKNGTWSTFYSTGAPNAEISACKNAATYTLRVDVSDMNSPKVTVLWPYVISVYNQPTASENGMWAFTEGANDKWSLSEWTMPSSITNIDAGDTHFWIGRGAYAGHSSNWSFGWIPFTKLKGTAGCDRTLGGATGAMGTLHIDASSGEDNYALSFDPTGYCLLAYSSDNESSGILGPLSPTSSDPTIWETDLFTSLQYDAGTYCRTYLTKTVGTPSSISDITAASRTSEANSMTVARLATDVPQKKNATDYYADNLDIKYRGRAGKFRIDTKSCEANWNAYFVPYIHCLLNANAPAEQITQQAWAGPALLTGRYFSIETSDEERTFSLPPAIAATTGGCPWVRTGYTFKCWDTHPDGLGRTIMPGETITVSEEMILTETGQNNLQAPLYAQWLKNDNVTLHRNLTAADATVKVQETVETRSSTLDACSEWSDAKPGYAIAGWSLSPGGPIAYEAGGQIITMGIDVDLYAIWKQTVTITYHENRPTANHSYSESRVEGMGYELRRFRDFKADTPSWDHSGEGVRFAHWDTQADDLGISYDDGDRITLTGNMDLYAQWDVNCTITYHPNGADGGKTMASATVASGKDYTLTKNAYVWTTQGHYFVGWATSEAAASAGLVTYHNQEVIQPSGNLDLYAVWRIAKIGDYIYYRCNTTTGKANHQIALNNSSKAIVDVTLANNTSACYIWLMESVGNGSQFYLRNYVNDDYYLCCDQSGTLSVSNDGSKTAWNREGNNFYYTDLNLVNHYIVWDVTWKTITDDVDDYQNEVQPGEIVHKDFLAGSAPSTTTYDELVDPKSPSAVYKADATGKQTLQFQYTWSTEEYFRGFTEAWDCYFKIVSRTKQSMTDLTATYSITEKTRTGFSFVEQTASFSADKKTYSVPLQVAPIDGVNLKNQKSLGKYVDYCDSVICSVTIDTMHMTHRIAMIRRTAYDKDDDRVSLSLRNAESQDIHAMHFTYNDLVSTVSGTLSGHHFCQSGEYYSYNDYLIRSGVTKADHDISVNLLGNTDTDVFTAHIVDDATGAVATWAEAVKTANTITVRMREQNDLGRIRTARLIITHRHTGTIDGEERSLMTSLSIEISQGSRFTDTDGDLLIRNKGVKNSTLDERGLQRVHTQEQTYYYLPGDEIILEPRERHMWGWQLWYDYDNLLRIPDKIAAFPEDYICYKTYANGLVNNLHVIGTGDNSQGIYGTAWGCNVKDDVEENAVAKVRLTIPNDWTGTHRIAGEFSNNMDYGQTFNTQDRKDGDGNVIGKLIYEPTLSYRQVWTLRPASEMAAKMESSKSGSYVESYKITACAEQGVTLTPQHHIFHYAHAAQLGYIYQDGEGHYHRIGDKNDPEALQPKAYITMHGVTRQIDLNTITTAHFDEANDYLIVDGFHSGNLGDAWDGVSELNITYTMEAGDYKIIRWEVTFVPRSQVGPLAETEGKALITNDDIYDHYIVLSKSTFDYNRPLTDAVRYYGSPLTWEESSSAFFYHNDALRPVASSKYKSDPFRGEYLFVNTTYDLRNKNYWAGFDNRSGREDGYMLVVDASSQPGLITMLNVDQHLCSGQKMYCSAWLGNLNRLNSKGDNPTLQFSIRGKNNNEEQWHSVRDFITGAIPTSTKFTDGYTEGVWYQVNFEIDLQDDYDTYQVAVYDFASSGAGNDFVLDDIIIYANELPLEAYQASTSCSTTSVKSVIRMDYEAAKEDMEGTTIYYQVWNKTDNTHVTVEPAYRQADGKPAYDDCGTVSVPSRGQTPTGDKFASLSSMIQQHDHDVEAHQAWEDGGRVGEEPTVTCLGFVKEHINNNTRPELSDDRWILYLVHDAPMTSEKDYEVRVAYGYGDLSDTECALTSQLPVTNAYELLVNGEAQTSLTPTTCGNDEFSLSMNVNTILIDPSTGKQVKLTGETMNDWLLLENNIGAEGQDDVEPEAAFDVKAWRSKAGQDHVQADGTRGYTFDEVERALVYNLRQELDDNPNRFVTSLSQIDQVYLNSADDYQIIQALVASGELSLGTPSTMVYMHPNDLVRYAVMPVIGSAYDQNGDRISMCYTASFVAVGAPPYTDYKLDNGKVALADLPEQLRGKPTRIRVGLNQAETTTVPMQLIERKQVILPDQMYLVSSTDPNFDSDLHWLAFEPDKKYNFGGVTTNYYDEHNDVCQLSMLKSGVPAGKTLYKMRAGYEYTFQIDLLSSDGLSVETRGDKDCAIGVGYFTLAIVPDYLRWTPGVNGNNKWQDDTNWTAVDALGRTLTGAAGFVPLDHSNVIIPMRGDGQYPIISTVPDELNNYDQNYQPAVCNAIYFESGAKLGNQSDLDYNKVFADLTLTAQRWYIVSLPLQEVVSGDMAFYIDGSDNQPFAPLTGDVNRSYNSSYISVYSKTYGNYNPEGTTFEADTIAMASTGWSNVLNSLSEPFVPGQALSMMLWRGDDAVANATIRLPRPDTRYSYYYENGDQSPYGEDITRDNNKVGKFAFAPDGSGDMQLTLTNINSSAYFAFGNPTMAYIDLYKFLQANSSVISSTFYYHSDGQWVPMSTKLAQYGAVTPTEEALFALAPCRGIMVRTKNGNAATSLSLTLSSDMLSIYPYTTTVPSSAPKRQSSISSHQSSLLTLTAANSFVEDDTYSSRVRLGESTLASNAVMDGEDLTMMSANAGTSEDGWFATPLNMYVVDDQHALSVDLRESLTCLPLLFNYGNGYTPGETIRLWAHGVNDFSYPIYLSDTLTGRHIRLQEGLYIDLPTPAANTLRYYILAERDEAEEEQNPGTTTAISRPEACLTDVQVITEGNGRLSIVCNYPMLQVTAYDVVGRTVSTTHPNAEATHLSLPGGVYILEISTAVGMAERKVFVR